MGLKSDIRKAINTNTKFTVVQVYKPYIDSEDMRGEYTMTIEVRMKKKYVRKKVSEEFINF